MSSLFLFHVGSNAGYAIRPLEELFLRAGAELGGEVHFAYRDLQRGRPLKPRYVLDYDFTDRSRQNQARLVRYVRQHGIERIVAFDFEPIDPLIAAVRAAGVRSFVAYWGAPLSGKPAPRWKQLAHAAAFRMAPSKVDAVIVESRAVAETALRDRGVPPELVHVVPLGVRTDLWKPAESSYVHETFGFPRDARVIVYSGHFEERKGVHVLVEAARKLCARRDDVTFLLCGNRPGEEARFGDTGPRIRFGGYRRDLQQIFPSCFAGAIASTGWDSFTYSSVEMAACGLPVVASDLQGLREAVLHERTGLLFEPGNSDALAAQLTRLLDDPALARRLGAAGRARVVSELSVEAQLRGFLAALAPAPMRRADGA